MPGSGPERLSCPPQKKPCTWRAPWRTPIPLTAPTHHPQPPTSQSPGRGRCTRDPWPTKQTTEAPMEGGKEREAPGSLNALVARLGGDSVPPLGIWQPGHRSAPPPGPAWELTRSPWQQLPRRNDTAVLVPHLAAQLCSQRPGPGGASRCLPPPPAPPPASRLHALGGGRTPAAAPHPHFCKPLPTWKAADSPGAARGWLQATSCRGRGHRASFLPLCFQAPSPLLTGQEALRAGRAAGGTPSLPSRWPPGACRGAGSQQDPRSRT